ncbi:hypothetical protein GCM10023170_094810 [Phytohabitans houttuyneae]|uniref:Uncharacterized protein n=1 Tax=Phytohabitans houttuyneae TaxID=1076126 RepID=A0A6V8K101_9ACTN|nr:hypothetical protein Phou_015340 [Phytohabitans houttuyneae]
MLDGKNSRGSSFLSLLGRQIAEEVSRPGNRLLDVSLERPVYLDPQRPRLRNYVTIKDIFGL